jgi:hypothetical protein
MVLVGSVLSLIQLNYSRKMKFLAPFPHVFGVEKV